MDQHEKQTSPANHDGLTWAMKVLDLDVPSKAHPDTLQAAALNAFFHRLKDSEFFLNDVSSDAVEVIFGKSPEICESFRDATEQLQLAAIDDIVQWYAERLGVADREASLAELRNRLSPFNSQMSLPNSRRYAQQVQQAANVTTCSIRNQNVLARLLAQAVFQISAIRSSQRRAVRTRFVRRFRTEYSHTELALAVKLVESTCQIPNKVFHQPFLDLVTWPEYQTEGFRLGQPVSATSQSTVAYSKKFGQSQTKQSRQPSGSGTNWGWIFMAIVIGGFLSALARNSTNDNNKTTTTQNFELPKMHIIVFDKDDPNKYAIESVALADSIGKTTKLVESPEHPGPFTQVPISEINRETPATDREMFRSKFSLPNSKLGRDQETFPSDLTPSDSPFDNRIPDRVHPRSSKSEGRLGE